jgi:4-carboxymuconolactone decarboxylase
MEPQERVAPPATLDEETAALLALTARAGGRPAGTMAVLAHRPALLGPFLGWAAALALEGGLSHRQHELLALRVANQCASPFEWDEHVAYARAAGLDDGEIARVAAGPDAEGWSAGEAALLRAADELVAATTVANATWDALATHFDAAALVEIVFVVGQYTMLSMVANALGVPSD